MNLELTFSEMEILAVLAINAIELNEFSPGLKMDSTLVKRLESAHQKLLDALEAAINN